MKKINLFWFRRDLRLHDNAGLFHALKNKNNVLPVFIFDTNILDELENPEDARVAFIYHTISRIKEELEKKGSTLLVKYGVPEEIWQSLLEQYKIATVFTNHDYEPYAIQRDSTIKTILAKHQIELLTFKDHVIFEKSEVVKDDQEPYTVFTPYSRKWRTKLESQLESKGLESSFYLKSYPTETYFNNLHKHKPTKMPTLKSMGFKGSDIDIPSKTVKRSLIKNYDKTRNFPGIEGTSRLSIHFRFGTISIREKARKALTLNATYLNELIWRDFYAMILFHFPKVVTNAFREKYERIEWRNNEDEFQLWCQGKTGYPIVDAGMRELSSTGYMHNRVRMITASFLTKHLLIDWRWGEAWFAEKLLDYDLASNNGGWQWAAGCGTDAAPYFRIFNPESQQKKFDKDFIYIKKWVPEFGTADYVEPVVDHKFARERCLSVYKTVLKDG